MEQKFKTELLVSLNQEICMAFKGGGTSHPHMVAKGSYLQNYLHHRL